MRGEFKDCFGKINVGTSPIVGAPPTFLGYNVAVAVSANHSVSRFWLEFNEGKGSAPIVHDNGGKCCVIPQHEVI